MGAPPTTTGKIPLFDSLEEQAEFWDTPDSTKLEGEWEPVEWTVGDVTSHFKIETEFD